MEEGQDSFSFLDRKMRNYLLAKKKGQIDMMAPAILALVFAAIVLVFGLIMSQNLRDVPDDVPVIVTDNEAGWINQTGYTLDAVGTACGFNSPVITGADNATGGAIPSANYTVSAAGVVSNITVWDSPSVTFNYTYEWGDTACIAGNDTVVGLSTFADFWEIIVLAIVITIVIGLLLIVFGGRRER